MKRIMLLLACFISIQGWNAQITLDNTYQGNFFIHLTKLQNSGYKYVKPTATTIELYNINHSLFNTITIPPVFGAVQTVMYVSESTFNTDNLIEYAIQTYSAGSTNKYRVYIFNQNGTQLLMRDSATLSAFALNDIGSLYNPSALYFDGVNTKLKLIIRGSGATAGNVIKNEVYTLAGTLPCAECTSGTVTGMPTLPSGTGNGSEAVF
jgi:hypothetical protein